METLGNLSSMGRSSKTQEAAEIAVEKASNGGGPNMEEIDNEPLVGHSPPRAQVTDDADDYVEEVEDAGDDDSYDTALEKIGTSTTASFVPKSVEERGASENDEETEIGIGNGPRESFSNSVDEESSNSSPDVEEDETLMRQVSVRAMPVAKLTSENEEQEDVEEDGN